MVNDDNQFGGRVREIVGKPGLYGEIHGGEGLTGEIIAGTVPTNVLQRDGGT
jgi:hypothetical protein